MRFSLLTVRIEIREGSDDTWRAYLVTDAGHDIAIPHVASAYPAEVLDHLAEAIGGGLARARPEGVSDEPR